MIVYPRNRFAVGRRTRLGKVDAKPQAARPQAAEPPAARKKSKYLALVFLAGYLLFCHGCHGDEDNELFARLLAPTVTVHVP